MLYRRVLSVLIGLTMGLTLAVAQAQTASVSLKVEAINSSLQSPWVKWTQVSRQFFS